MWEKLGAFWQSVFGFVRTSVAGPLSEIRIIDIIDIALLSIVFFWMYKFIRQRRAGPLALGLLLFIVAALIGSLFDIRAMKFIFENFYQVGMIAIIIIFQSDLRAVLERVGNTPIKTFRNFTDNDIKAYENIAETIATVCDSLSRTKTGALIVLERETKLGDYTGQGVILNAEISQMLLRNLFFNKAPLHDGAVLIRGRRIYAAGCYLPMSSADVNKDLGTRHRAGIGLSEVSDAVVIIVSEETGTVSVAVGGELQRGFNYGSLRQEIISRMIPEEVRNRKLNSVRKAGRSSRRKNEKRGER